MCVGHDTEHAFGKNLRAMVRVSDLPLGLESDRQAAHFTSSGFVGLLDYQIRKSDPPNENTAYFPVRISYTR